MADTDLLASVEALRASFPPEEHAPPPDHPRRREEALVSLKTLAEALSTTSAPALQLHRVQFEVIFRQMVHILVVMKAWEASGTAEECMNAVLCCINAVLVLPLVSADAGQLLSGDSLRDLTGQALSELLLAAAAQPSASLRAACLGSVTSICRPPASGSGLA